MRAQSLALHLRDFSAPRLHPSAPAVAPAPRDIEGELAAVRAAGFAEGHAAGFAEAEAEYAVMLDDELTRHQHLIVLARTAWVDETADQLASCFETAFAEAEDTLAADLARVLAEVAVLARRAWCVEDMLAQLGPLLRDDAIVRLDVSGPTDLTEALRARLSAGLDIRQGASDGADLAVRVGRTVLTTRLATWRSKLLAAVEA